MPAGGRMKVAVRRAIAHNGGCDGAGMTAGRCKSVAGDWNNLNSGTFPPLDCALALDEVAVASGQPAEIAAAFARALGGVFVMLPCAEGSGGAMAGGLVEIMERLGPVAGEMRRALEDGTCTPREAARVRDELAKLLAAVAQFDAALLEVENSEGVKG